MLANTRTSAAGYLCRCYYLIVTAFASVAGAQTAPATAPTTKPFEPFPAPGFSFTDQNGQTVTAESLRGRAWVADFIFTRCTTACPIMTARMVLLQRMIADPEVRFVSFSVDPANDTPEAMKEYQQKWNADDRRWILLSTDPPGLRETAVAMRIAIKEVMSADNPIIHSTFFLLVGPDGVVRGQYNSVDETALMRLAADVRQHSPTDDARPQTAAATSDDEPPEKAGERLYAALGCAACHTNAKVGPHLTGLFGRDVLLADNTFAKADDAYLRESILDPARKIVKGYGNSMPRYTGHVTDTEARHLAAYIRTLGTSGTPGGPTAPPPPALELALDPICNMNVTVTSDALKAEHDGKTYYFCNPMCVERFKQEPQQYTGVR